MVMMNKIPVNIVTSKHFEGRVSSFVQLLLQHAEFRLEGGREKGQVESVACHTILAFDHYAVIINI